MLSRVLFIFIVLTTALSSNLLGQDFRKDGKNGIGVRLGVNSSTVRFVPNVNTNSFIGYYAGLQFIHIRRVTGFSAELAFVEYGWDENLENTGEFEYSGEVYRRRLSYLELPLLTYLRSQKGKVHFLGFVGPKVSYMFKEQVLDTTPSDFERYYYGESIAPHFEFGLLFGAGVTVSFEGIGEFGIEGRYNISFSNLFEREDTSPEVQYSQPQGFVISLHYWYFIE